MKPQDYNECIKKLNCHLKSNGYCECDKCDYDTNASFVDTLKKAISDMEKLEKIEQLIDDCRAWPDDMSECLIEIEQIVKGE